MSEPKQDELVQWLAERLTYPESSDTESGKAGREREEAWWKEQASSLEAIVASRIAQARAEQAEEAAAIEWSGVLCVDADIQIVSTYFERRAAELRQLAEPVRDSKKI